MRIGKAGGLEHKQHYLQVALNSSLGEAQRVIASLPASGRIIIEAGTPLIKEYGEQGIRAVRSWWERRLQGYSPQGSHTGFEGLRGTTSSVSPQGKHPNLYGLRNVAPGEIYGAYVVADLKCMDRGEREVEIAKRGGASAAVVLGLAPVETLDAFIDNCNKAGLDAMVDMMNVDKPYQILRKLSRLPRVAILHRGVDEEQFSNKPLPIHMINKVKGTFDVMVAVAGGDSAREIQSAVFNGADIVVLWKDFYRAGGDAAKIAGEFLEKVK